MIQLETRERTKGKEPPAPVATPAVFEASLQATIRRARNNFGKSLATREPAFNQPARLLAINFGDPDPNILFEHPYLNIHQSIHEDAAQQALLRVMGELGFDESMHTEPNISTLNDGTIERITYHPSASHPDIAFEREVRYDRTQQITELTWRLKPGNTTAESTQ